jgi:hypothetical protein
VFSQALVQNKEGKEEMDDRKPNRWQYQEIGFNLIARLGAIYKTKKSIMPKD